MPLGKRLLYGLLVLIMRVMPRELACRIARKVSGINHRLDRRGREGVVENMRVILGPEADESRVREAAREVFRSYSMYMVELMGARYFLPEIAANEIETEGFEAFTEIARARGVVLVSAHFSNPYVGTALFDRHGLRALAVVLRQHIEVMRLVWPDRREPPMREQVPVEDALRRCLQALTGEKRIVTVLGDRPFGEKGVEVEMFGRKVCFPQGPARMALLAEAPMVPAFIVRGDNGRFIGLFHEPIRPPESGSASEKAIVMTQEFARRFEEVLRKYPSQWHLFYKVFDPPGGVPPDPMRMRMERKG